MPIFGKVNIDKYCEQGDVKKLLQLLLKSKDEKQSLEVRNALRKLGSDTVKSQERTATWQPYQYDTLFNIINKLGSIEKQHIALIIQKLKEEKQDADRKEKAKLELRQKIKARFQKAFTWYHAHDSFYDELGSILGKDRKFSFKIKLTGAQALRPDGIIVTKYHFIYFVMPRRIIPILISDIADVKVSLLGKLIITRKDGSTFKVDVQTSKAGSQCQQVVSHIKQALSDIDNPADRSDVIEP